MVLYQPEVITRSLGERTNEAWIQALCGPRPDRALSDLRVILRRGLGVVLADRWPDAPTEKVEELVEKTVTNILNNLNIFSGRSRFTTWAMKYAVRAALSELRRHGGAPPGSPLPGCRPNNL